MKKYNKQYTPEALVWVRKDMYKCSVKSFLKETFGDRNPFRNVLGSCRGNRAIGIHNLLETILNVDIPAVTGHCGVPSFNANVMQDTTCSYVHYDLVW